MPLVEVQLIIESNQGLTRNNDLKEPLNLKDYEQTKSLDKMKF